MHVNVHARPGWWKQEVGGLRHHACPEGSPGASRAENELLIQNLGCFLMLLCISMNLTWDQVLNKLLM